MSHPHNPRAARPSLLSSKAILLPVAFDAGNLPMHVWVEPEMSGGRTVGYLLKAVTLPGRAEDLSGVLAAGVVDDAQAFADKCFRADSKADSPSAFTVLPSQLAAFGGYFSDDLQRLEALGVGV